MFLFGLECLTWWISFKLFNYEEYSLIQRVIGFRLQFNALNKVSFNLSIVTFALDHGQEEEDTLNTVCPDNT